MMSINYPRVSIREVLESDIDFIAQNIRKADKQELEALFGVSHEEGLKISIEGNDELWVAVVDNLPVCIFGISDRSEEQDEHRTGLVWAIGTNNLFHLKKELNAVSKKVIEKWLDEYDILFNYVWEKNVIHHRWLKKMGFIIMENEYMETDQGDKFYFFVQYSPYSQEVEED